jgi:hypothetical protein
LKSISVSQTSFALRRRRRITPPRENKENEKLDRHAKW